MDHSLQGWPIDLKKLYGWSGWARREKFHLREHVFEAPGQDACVLLYHIGEIGVSKDVGRLAAFSGKTDPQLIFSAGRTLFWYDGDGSLTWSPDGRLAFVSEFKEIRGFFDFLAGKPARQETIPMVLNLPNRSLRRP